MLAVAAPLEDVAPLAEAVSVAAVNGPTSVVLSGEEEAIAAVARQLDGVGVRHTRLQVSHAFHSSLMDPVLGALADVAATVRHGHPRIPWISTLPAVPEETAAAYWTRHARDAVHFSDGVVAAHAAGARRFVELGPRPTLSRMVRRILGPDVLAEACGPAYAGADETMAALDALGALYVTGDGPHWAGVVARRVPVDLPTYPWQRQRYWIAPADEGHPFDVDVADVPDGMPVVATATIDRVRHAWLADHRVHGAVVVPGACLVELSAEVGRQLGVPSVSFTQARPVVLGAGATRLQWWVQPEADGRRAFEVFERRDTAWARVASGHLSAGTAVRAAAPRVSAWEAFGGYAALEARGLAYGPAFRGLRHVAGSGTERFSRVSAPASGFALNPVLLDAALHRLPLGAEALLLPVSWRDVQLLGATTAATVRVRTLVDGPLRVAVEAWDDAGALVWSIGELVLMPARADQITPRPPMSVQVWRPVPEEASPMGDTVVWGGDGALAAALGVPHVQRLAAPLPSRVVVDATADGDALDRASETLERVRVAVEAGATEWVWVTHGALSGARVSGAPTWGLIRSARTKHRRPFRLVDADAVGPHLRDAVVRTEPEPELAWRDGALRAPALVDRPAMDGETRVRGTVLLTGATGALGRRVALHLARHHDVATMVLASRRGPDSEAGRALVAQLEEAGVHAELRACDVADADAVHALVADLPDDVTAVFHCAGLTRDGALAGMGRDDLAAVFAPKVAGATHLDAATRHLRGLRHFVLFSSIAGVIGTAGQANYAAANAFLDALAARRVAQGLPGTSLAWGLWRTSDGMGAELTDADLARLRRAGIGALTEEEGLALLDEALAHPDALLVPARRHAPEPEPSAPEVPSVSWTSMPADARRAAVHEVVSAAVCAVLRVPRRALSDDQVLAAVGLDSLTALELRERLQDALGVDVPANVAFDHPTVGQLTAHLDAAFEPDVVPEPEAALDDLDLPDLDGLSDEELVAMVRSL
jgi:acyl transferase domain-containing protein